VQNQEILPNKVGVPGGQRCKKDLFGQSIVLVPRTPGIHSGRVGGVAAVYDKWCHAVWSIKDQMVSYSEMRMISLVDGKSISKIF